MANLPEVNYGTPGNPAPDSAVDETEDDDEELETTPQEVIDMLGFDPKELNDDNESNG